MISDIFIRLLIFDVLISFVIAKLEVNIEGKYGWAENLPTWRIKNWVTEIFWGSQPYTGYHFWMLCTVFVFIHLPIFIFPNLWTVQLELLVLSNFLFCVVLEDFFWFLVNPYYSIKKFNKTHVPWHQWVGFLPILYIKASVLSVVFLILAFYIF